MERYADNVSMMEANRAAFDSIAWEDQDESRKQRLVPLNTGEKYVFRVKPGTLRDFGVRIPTPPDDFKDEKTEKKYMDRFNKRRAKRDNGKFDLEAVREAVGGDWIAFKHLPGGPDRQSSSFYATSDENVYEFLRNAKDQDTSGYWDNIFIEYPGKSIEVNGRKYPATDAGWQAAQAAMRADDSSVSE